MHRYIIAIALAFAITGHAAFADLKLGGSLSDDKISIVYTSETGELSLEAGNQIVSAIELRSKKGQFLSIPRNSESNPFDMNSDSKIFRIDPSGFSKLQFGTVLPPNLPGEMVAADLELGGTTADGRRISTADLVMVAKGVTQNGEDAATITKADEKPPESYVVHLSEVTTSAAVLPRIIASQSLDELETNLSGMVKGKVGQVTRKLQTSIHEDQSTTIRTTRTAVPKPRTTRTSRSGSSSETFSISMTVESLDDDTVGIHVTLSADRPRRTYTTRSRSDSTSSYIETSLNKPSFIFGASGKEARVYFLTITKP